MANNNNQRTNTSTQIRNFYSDGMSYLNVSFFNTNLSFRFYPFISKDNIGRSTYDMKNGLNTTVNYEGAYALLDVANDIIDGKINETNLPIPCAAGASLKLERKLAQDGTMETIFSITKNNITIGFRFNTMTQQTKVNGQLQTKVIESGLGAFAKTIEGYLTGINSDRHLDKLTEDFAKLQENNGNDQQQNGYSSYQSNGGNNNYRRYNNGGNNRNYNGRKNYNNNQQFNPNGNSFNSAPNQQNINTYQIPN